MTTLPEFHSEGALRASDRALFWTPRLGTGPLAPHLPLLCWLAAQLRPRICVTIGDVDGTAHFALCEAVDRLGTQGFCEGFGPWPGPGVPEPLRRHARTHHPQISVLRPDPRPDDEEAPPPLPDRIDLLVSAAPPSDAAAEAIRATWMARMAPGGVVVLRGDATASGAAARAALAGGLPRLDLPHGGGLTVIAMGEATPLPVRRLIAPGPGRAGDLAVLGQLSAFPLGGEAERLRTLMAMTAQLAAQDVTWRRALDAMAEERDAQAEDAADLARRLQAARNLYREEVEAERRAAAARRAGGPPEPETPPAPLRALSRLARKLGR